MAELIRIILVSSRYMDFNSHNSPARIAIDENSGNSLISGICPCCGRYHWALRAWGQSKVSVFCLFFLTLQSKKPSDKEENGNSSASGGSRGKFWSTFLIVQIRTSDKTGMLNLAHA